VETDKSIYEQWIEIVKNTHSQYKDSDIPIYNLLSENFYREYRETSNSAFLIFALHEAGVPLRVEIIDSLTEDELAGVSDVVQKMHYKIITPDYFQIRDFSPSDIYSFIFSFDIPEEMDDEALALLDHWYNTLDESYAQDSLMGTFKAQALSVGYGRLGEYDKVADLTAYLLRSPIFPSSLFSLSLYENLIYPLYMRGQYSLAIRVFEQALLPIVNDLGDLDDIIYNRMNYASTLFLIGDVNGALDEYEKLYAEDIIDLNSSRYLNLLRFLSISHLRVGNFDKYTEYLQKQFEIGISEELHDFQLHTLVSLYHHHQTQFDHIIAYDYINQALELANEHNLKEDLSEVLIALSLYYRDTINDYELTIENLENALEIAKETGFYRDLRIVLINLAETYALIGNDQEAESYFKQTVELTSSADDPVGYLSTSMSYSQWLIKIGRIADAKQLFSQFEFNDIRTYPFYNRVQYQNVEVSLLIDDGSYQEAITISNQVINDVIDWILQSSDHQTGHMQIRTQFSEAFRLNSKVMEISGNVEEALTANGRLRGISRTGFYNNPALKSSILSEEDLVADYNLGVRIQNLRDRYAVGNDQQKDLIRPELTNAVTERNRLVNQAFPRYLDSQYGELIGSRRSLLKRGEMVIYFSKFEDQMFQYFITRSDVTMKSYPHDSSFYEPIKEAIASFGYRTTNLEVLYELYQTYFEGNIPPGIEHLYIVPDDELYRIPVEILPIHPVESSHSFGSAEYMIEKYSISYLNTLADLQITQPDRPDNFDHDITGFGISNFRNAGHQQLADLPFSPIEVVNSINNLDSFEHSNLLLEESSSETNFRNMAGNSKIIHMATHSRVIDNNPLFSSLYLYNDPDIKQNNNGLMNDGIVRAYEIFDLNLNADLVFLSSCESGSGGYIQGSGILGFSRAFAFAGAKSLILNLWPVRDQASAELTPQFYGYLNRGYDKAESIREAKLNYINQRDSDPFLWGSFVIYGNTKPLIKQEGNYFMAASLTILSILGLLFLLSYFRRFS
tara:strand:- start:55942 stop:58995 length:3054 start_codon:yes stop_codon:yes gene_type:complete